MQAYIKHKSTNMNTNDKLKEYLKEHLDTKSFKLVSQKSTGNTSASTSTLLSMAHGQIPANVLILMKHFLESLPIEEAREYVSYADINGNSAFLLGDANLLKIIIKYVPNINVQNVWGNNALVREWVRVHALTFKPNVEKIKLLLDSGININAVNNSKNTALICFCRGLPQCEFHIEEILEILMRNGANPFIKSSEGKMAFDYVRPANKLAMSERSLQLLQGVIRANRTKRAQ